MLIEETRVRIKETGEVKKVSQIRLDEEEIVIIKEGKKYIYPFKEFNYIPCYGAKKDVNNWNIYHRDVLSFTLDGAPLNGVIYWNQHISKWVIYDVNQIAYDPQEVTDIEILANEMNSNWQSWR